MIKSTLLTLALAVALSGTAALADDSMGKGSNGSSMNNGGSTNNGSGSTSDNGNGGSTDRAHRR